MAKYAGLVGYAISKTDDYGVTKEEVTEHKLRGDVMRLGSSNISAEKVNDDIQLDSRFSLIADLFAYANFQSMKYITYLGVKWKITSVEVQRPRIIVNVGGVYNG